MDARRAGHLEPRRLSAGALPQPDVHNGHDPLPVKWLGMTSGQSTVLGALSVALGSLGAVPDAKLVQDVADVRFDGAW